MLDFHGRSAQLKPDGKPVLDAQGQPIPADLHVAQYADEALQQLQAPRAVPVPLAVTQPRRSPAAAFAQKGTPRWNPAAHAGARVRSP